jgi:hypothetical protein
MSGAVRDEVGPLNRKRPNLNGTVGGGLVMLASTEYRP